MDETLVRILDLFKEKNLYESKVLSELEINTSFFSDWKKGKIKNPSYDKILKIANYLNVSLDYLVTGECCNNNLSEEEENIIKLYRSLDLKDKYKILGMLELKSMENLNKKINSSNLEKTDENIA